MSKQALIIVDIQNDYFENGAIELVNPIEASVNAGKVLGHFRANNFIQGICLRHSVLPILQVGTQGSGRRLFFAGKDQLQGRS